MNTATETVPCLGCDTPIDVEAAAHCFGRCFQCQCESHSTGEINMDATDGYDGYDRFREDIGEDGPDDTTPPDAAWYWNLERDRLTHGVRVSLTVSGVDPCWDIPF